MNKTEFIKSIADNNFLTNKKTKEIVDDVFNLIMETVSNGDSVAIAGFGIFKPITKQEHSGRNPKTGEAIVIPKRCVPKFTPSKTFKDICNAKEN